MVGSSRRSLLGCPARPTSPGSGRAVSRRVRPGVAVTQLARRAALQVGSALGFRSKALGLLHPSPAKAGSALTQRSTRTQPQAAASFRPATNHRSGFVLRLFAAGLVNFHRLTFPIHQEEPK